MHDFVAIISAAQETARFANEARPNAPVRPDTARAGIGGGFSLPRQRLSLGLRWLADLIEPAPRCPMSADTAPR